jgi:hypothetical protein
VIACAANDGVQLRVHQRFAAGDGDDGCQAPRVCLSDVAFRRAARDRRLCRTRCSRYTPDYSGAWE